MHTDKLYLHLYTVQMADAETVQELYTLNGMNS